MDAHNAAWTERCDVAVIGAGIAGLSHALAAARLGYRVVVIDRSPKAEGASVRNFGMFWPIGMARGRMLGWALRSREIWIEAAKGAGFFHEPKGSLHVAYHDDEAAVLREFESTSHGQGYKARWVTSETCAAVSPGIVREGLIGGLLSETEICVESPAAISMIPGWLTREFGVRFRFATAAKDVHSGLIETSDGGRIEAERIFICHGEDVRTLFPNVYADAPMVRCKLQMMSSVAQPNGWRMGPMLAAGLTLRHYRSFVHCPSLTHVKERFARTHAEYDRLGIHVMASQHGHGGLILGDSHEYGMDITPFDREEIDSLILDYLHGFFMPPTLQIARRWHGTYIKMTNDQAAFAAEPEPGVHLLTGLGGCGMTLSFGLADERVPKICAGRGEELSLAI